MKSRLVRNLAVPSSKPGIAKELERHADIILKPTITNVGNSSSSNSKVKILGVFQEDVDDRVKAKIGPQFEGKPGQRTIVYDVDYVLGRHGRRILYGRDEPKCYFVYVGLGPKNKFDAEAARKFGAVAVRTAEELKSAEVDILLPTLERKLAETAENIVLGAGLASYRFNRKIGTPKNEEPTQVNSLTLMMPEPGIFDAIERGLIRADCQNTSRYLTDMPSNELNTGRYVSLLQLLAWKYELQFGILTPEQLLEMGRGGIYTVGRGAAVPGAMVILGRFTDEKAPLDVLVGKGIVFDTGGYSLKTPSEHMNGMHMDMQGSASVAGAIAAAAKLSVGGNVLGLLCIAQNAVGPEAVMPTAIAKIGDRTVQIMNTDAEGRLVMGDGVSVGSELRPRSITTLSTLTGACILACGEGMRAGLMTTDDKLRELYLRAGEVTGEKIQPFFMDHPFLTGVLGKGGPADLLNLGPRPGGHLTAQAFLKAFAHHTNSKGKEVEVPYAGLDMAPVMTADGALAEDPRFRGAKYATGWGVQLLTEALARK
ncbi:MAG: M17 family peptidase N-terminal domain-containing protein [Candidatus Micrarchaeota archaeon]|nr:M17 family peptidase N-terminal domain-containing protein [Candidatus Micrarchaeota archaeon]